MYQNCSLILKFHLLSPGPTKKISTENRQSKSVYKQTLSLKRDNVCSHYLSREIILGKQRVFPATQSTFFSFSQLQAGLKMEAPLLDETLDMPLLEHHKAIRCIRKRHHTQVYAYTRMIISHGLPNRGCFLNSQSQSMRSDHMLSAARLGWRLGSR